MFACVHENETWTSCHCCDLDRPSTRLHAPPGGKSSICFGDYSEPVEKPVRRAQNVNTLADIVNGQSTPRGVPGAAVPKAEEAPAPTRRVRQAPGGTSSIVLG